MPLRFSRHDLDELGLLLEMDDSGDKQYAWLDLQTGKTIVTMGLYGFDEADEEDDEGVVVPLREEQLPAWRAEQREEVRAIFADRSGRYVELPVGAEAHRPGKLHAFARTLTDATLYEQVRDAMRGRGAFRRVKDLLYREGKLDLWHHFEEEQRIQAARDWLTEAGVEWEEVS